MSYHQSKTSILSSLDKDYIEEGRRDIYKWGETRKTRRRGIRGWAYAFKKMFIDKNILKSFVNNLTAVLVLQLILSGLITYICQRLDLYLDVNIALFVSPIVFPLAFSINADFQRREHVLEDLALFKGGLIILFFCHRDWHVKAGLPQEFLKAVTNKLKGLILNIKEYLLTEKISKRSFILKVIYEDFSDISQMNEKLRMALPDSASLIQRVIHYHNLMFWAFERLRVVREYRSPRGIRSFTKVFIFVMPLILSPYYVFVGKSSSNVWGPYYISLISTFVFGTLQGVQDVLDDPFDGISEDDVNLGSLEDWTAHSLLTNRTYTIGRFTVTTSLQPKEKEEFDLPETFEAREVHERNVSRNASRNASRNPSFNKRRSSIPVKSILRRTSHRPDVDKPDTLCEISEKDVDALYPEMALRLQSMKTKDVITGSTTILPGFQVKDRPPSEELVDGGSFVGTPGKVGQSQSDAAKAHARRRAFKKNVSFSKDMDDEVNDNISERISESSSNDDSPLIRQSARDNIGFSYPEPDPDKIPEHLRAAFQHLQNSSSTDRVMKPREPSTKSKTPESLSNLFNPPDKVSQADRPPPPPPSNLATMFEPINKEKEQKPPLIELPTVNVQPPSRFSVSPPKITKPTPSSDNISPTGSENIEKPQSNDPPSSSLPIKIPNKDSEPKVSRFAVTPSAQSTAVGETSPVNNVNVQMPSSTRFQVEKMRPPEETLGDEKQAHTNLALSSPSSSSIEDTASTNDKPTERRSRFCVSKPPNNIPTSTSPEQEDPPRKITGKGFWNFNGSTDDLVAEGPAVEDEDDGDRKKSLESEKLRKKSSVEDVLGLSGNRSGEVYI